MQSKRPCLMNDNLFLTAWAVVKPLVLSLSLSHQKNTNDTWRSLYLKNNPVVQSKHYNEIN